MKVAQLIEILQACDPDGLALVRGVSSDEYASIQSVAAASLKTTGQSCVLILSTVEEEEEPRGTLQ